VDGAVDSAAEEFLQISFSGTRRFVLSTCHSWWTHVHGHPVNNNSVNYIWCDICIFAAGQDLYVNQTLQLSVTLLYCILEVVCANTGLKTGYPEWRLSKCPSRAIMHMWISLWKPQLEMGITKFYGRWNKYCVIWIRQNASLYMSDTFNNGNSEVSLGGGGGENFFLQHDDNWGVELRLCALLKWALNGCGQHHTSATEGLEDSTGTLEAMQKSVPMIGIVFWFPGCPACSLSLCSLS
jgi:hypothetical protein